MDGLSGAASGMAVVSLVSQLGGSIKQLYDFWASLNEAPDHVCAITTDLSLLSSVLAEMAFEEQHVGPDPTLTTVLETCRDRINKLAHLTNDMEPGFASTSLRIRKWTAFKSALKGERIQRLQMVLEGLKTTLILAQQNHHSHLNRIRYQSQQQNLTAITEHLSSLKPEELSATVTRVSNSSSIANGQTNALRGQFSRIPQAIQSPVQRVGFELESDTAIQNPASNLSKDQTTTSCPLANSEIGRSALSSVHEVSRRSRQQTWTKDRLSVRNFVTETFFGAITTTTRTRLLRSGFIGDETLDDEECQYERVSSFRIFLARWLLKLGFNYAYSFSIYDSSTQGWQSSLKSINLVPDDASIFEFCRQGNIEKVRQLISRNLASVRDVDSEGRTALHFAARSHSPELCKFLLEVGADRIAQTFDPWSSRTSPLREVYRRPITKDGLVNAINTCRIFEASFDFWDEDGDGWEVLEWVPIFNRDQSTAEANATLTFLRWLIQSSSPDIKANYNTVNVFNILLGAYPGIADAVGLLLELGPPGAIDNLPVTAWGLSPLHHLISSRNWVQVKMVLALGANLHHVCFSNNRYSPRAESPFSMAMYSSWAFWSFRDTLQGANVTFKDLVRRELEQECPLVEAGWQMETLSTLLELDFEPDVEPSKLYERNHPCDSCRAVIWDVEVQPYWQGILESIKDGTYPQRFPLGTQDEQSTSSQRNLSISNKEIISSATDGSVLSHDPALPEDEAAQEDEESSTGGNATSSIKIDREEVWCIWCWYHFKETGNRRPSNVTETHSPDGDDSSEDDFSPLLFNTRTTT